MNFPICIPYWQNPASEEYVVDGGFSKSNADGTIINEGIQYYTLTEDWYLLDPAVDVADTICIAVFTLVAPFSGELGLQRWELGAGEHIELISQSVLSSTESSPGVWRNIVGLVVNPINLPWTPDESEEWVAFYPPETPDASVPGISRERFFVYSGSSL